MKLLGLFAAAVFAGPPVAHGQNVRDVVRPNPVRISSRLQLTAAVEQMAVKLGQPARVHLRYKNMSSGAIMLGTANWRLAYTLTVTDSSGAEPPRTALGESWLQEQRQTNQEPSLMGPKRLEPGAEGEEVVVDIAKYYQLSRPGAYFVRMMFRDIWPDPGVPWRSTEEEGRKVILEEALSNVVQFTIVP
jgi:hypothetical protein